MAAESYWTKPGAFEIKPTYFQAQTDRFLSLKGLSSAAGLRALDIGAGLGKTMTVLARRGFEVVGLEPSAPFRAKAIEVMGVGPEEILATSLEDATLDADQFDFITFGAVLEHLYDPATSIERAMRWLKPGGLIQAEVPSSAWLTNKIANMVYRFQGLDYAANISPMHPPFHLYEFSLRSFEMHAAAHGYSVADHRFIVASSYLPKVIDPLARKFMALTKTGMQLEVWLQKPATTAAVPSGGARAESARSWGRG
jgi:SAM-dependent methyltransferase